MTLQTTTIDDRTYEQLLAELKKQIPTAQWTDHNPSDPGIMLLELLAWQAEMSLYRMNRVPASHREKFVKLIADPPDPVTVEVELELTPARSRDFSLRAGIRFATDFKNGARYIFETFQPGTIPKPGPDAEVPRQKAVVVVRSWKEFVNEELGSSDGTPNQTFYFKNEPVLLDLVNADAVYKPNPEIEVIEADGTITTWMLKPFLATEGSGAASEQFMIDVFDHAIRFGDGVFGAIPPKDAKIVCTRYQVLEGPGALIKAGELKHILDVVPGLAAGEALTVIGNEDAMGGLNHYAKKERLARSLASLKRPYRLITAEDFEAVLLTDFNELQEKTRNNPFNMLTGPNFPDTLKKLQRIEVKMNRVPLSTVLEPAQGHVTVLALPELSAPQTQQLHDENVSLAIRQPLITLHSNLKEKIVRYLDTRRLITTRLHVGDLLLKAVQAGVIVVINKEMNELDVRERVKNKIAGFFDLLTGNYDQKGWPPGKSIRLSHVYALIENMEGVDHVSELTLTPALANGDVELGETELPALTALTVVAMRG